MKLLRKEIWQSALYASHLTDFIKTGEVKVHAFADETTVKIIGEYLSTNPEKTTWRNKNNAERCLQFYTDKGCGKSFVLAAK